ncbi:MAG: response regulator transcription factor [Tannerella sp.]|jgi:DNA-binding response OmpR family regulator|nr:response regulator transcription factor [Tannerella sp.]
MICLLLVEDDANLSYIIKSSLEKIIGGYEVITASNGLHGLSMVASRKPDIIVADIEMDEMNGYEMVKKIRLTDMETPIIFATAKVKPSNVDEGYSSGADLYVKKPFVPSELDCHIRSLISLKKDGLSKCRPEMYGIGTYTFDCKNYSLKNEVREYRLTVKEAAILKLLCQDRGCVVEREHILMQIWGTADFFTSRRLDVFTSRLRKYFSDDDMVEIKSLKGIGLCLGVKH